MRGISLNERIGRAYKEFHDKDDAKEFADRLNETFDTGESVQQEYRNRIDGRYFLRTLSPIKDSEGKTVLATMIAKDISNYKQVEEALRESERNIFNCILKANNKRKYLPP